MHKKKKQNLNVGNNCSAAFSKNGELFVNIKSIQKTKFHCIQRVCGSIAKAVAIIISGAPLNNSSGTTHKHKHTLTSVVKNFVTILYKRIILCVNQFHIRNTMSNTSANKIARKTTGITYN